VLSQDGSFEAVPEVLRAAGEIDLRTAPRLGVELLEALARGSRNLIVDMADVRLIDSTGIGVLLSAQRRFRALGGQLVVANVCDHVTTVLAITGVGRALNLQPSVAQAVAFIETADSQTKLGQASTSLCSSA
jgi:anti-sigma B factor antagonist